MKVALLTGGKDLPYARGVLRELLARGVDVACIGGDDLADWRPGGAGRLQFHNFVGSSDAGSALAKVWRVLRYYGRLLRFVAGTDARLVHILWFRKFAALERTVFTMYLKLLGKRVIFTAHNVDDRSRDGRASRLIDRLSLSFLYRTVDHVLVHTDRMKRELVEQFHASGERITVVPFGINDVIPLSRAPRSAVRQGFGFAPDQRVLLFFGNIAPYKGLEDLIRALATLVESDKRFVLIIAGPVKDRSCQPYWRELEALITDLGMTGHVRKEIRYIPDEEVGALFRASDVSVLPYRRIYQSGVLALSYGQGVPVIVADCGSLKEDVREGETGFVFPSGDVVGLAAAIRAYFDSELFGSLERRGDVIRAYGAERFSWSINADRTCAVYERLLQSALRGGHVGPRVSEHRGVIERLP